MFVSRRPFTNKVAGMNNRVNNLGNLERWIEVGYLYVRLTTVNHVIEHWHEKEMTLLTCIVVDCVCLYRAFVGYFQPCEGYSIFIVFEFIWPKFPS